MRQVTEVRTIVKYSELSESQKLKVLDRLHDLNTDHEWSEYTIEDATNLLGKLGFSDVKISFSVFSSQGDGASFTATFDVPNTVKELKERVKAFKAEVPKDNLYGFINLRFNKEDKEEGNLKVVRTNHFYSHSNTVSSDHEALTVFVRDFSNGLYRRLEKEYEYLISREAIEETIDCNNYEFDLDSLELE